jgi:hypothetical protein
MPRSASLVIALMSLAAGAILFYLLVGVAERELPLAPDSPLRLHDGLLGVKHDEPLEERERRRVAVAVLITTSLRTPGDVDKSLTGAAAMQRSVLEAYGAEETRQLRRLSRQNRRVGLPQFRSDLTEDDGGEADGEVDVFTFNARRDSAAEVVPVELRFVALVTPCVDRKWHTVIRRLGFEVWITRSPINASEVRNRQISEEIVNDGAMGINELAKLEGLRMSQFRTVIMVDCDVLFHRTFDELFFISSSLAWTHGGWESEKMNGGFLVFNPQSPHAMDHMLNILEILREGDFRPGTGWRGKGIGWTYGGRTIQGVLPHYFLLEAKTAVPADPAPHEEIERCRYNNMAQLEKCKAKPYAQVTSNHFTGDCVKPWWCDARGHELCQAFRRRWFSVYRSLLLSDVAENVTAASPALRQYVQAVPSAACPPTGFVSLAEEMVKLGH